MNGKNKWLFWLIILSVFLLFMAGYGFGCLAFHHNLEVPPGYHLITNGRDYKYVDSNGSTNSRNPYYYYNSKSSASADAWRDYDREQEYIRKSKEKWVKVEEN